MARDVCKGTRKIHAVGVEHWAVRVGDCWYEVEGTTVKQKGDYNRIGKHTNDLEYECICDEGQTTKTDEEIDYFNDKWIENHPLYSVFKDNCQLYVREFIAFLLEDKPCLVTQNNIVGGTVTAFGVVATVLGLAAICAGSIIKNH